MQSTNSEAQVTEPGQAIAINDTICRNLFELFSSVYGPNGSTKALFNGAESLVLTNDGYTICKNIAFTHPSASMITQAASSIHDNFGDGTVTFILLSTQLFSHSYKYFTEGSSIPSIINSLQLALKDVNDYFQANVVPLDDEKLRAMALTALQTKIRNPHFMVDVVIKALTNISKSKTLDTNMIEIIQMEDGDVKDTVFIDGLVLDHAGRHHSMPTQMEDVCIMVANMSLEYEKPEINSEFYYSSAKQRKEIADQENEFIASKARAIASFAKELKQDGKTLLLINEKGIDQNSLGILAEAGVLALRRAKRRNLERLIKMSGASLITQLSQITKQNMGYCRRVEVRDFGDNKYTIIQGTPLQGSCTILVRGNVDYQRMQHVIKGVVNCLGTAIQVKCCIHGGIPLYRNLMRHLKKKSTSLHLGDTPGYSIVCDALESLIKVLVKNEGRSINESIMQISKENGVDDSLVENIKAVGAAFNNAIYMATNLLMCDEIIKAGKSIGQENK